MDYSTIIRDAGAEAAFDTCSDYKDWCTAVYRLVLKYCRMKRLSTKDIPDGENCPRAFRAWMQENRG